MGRKGRRDASSGGHHAFHLMGCQCEEMIERMESIRWRLRCGIVSQRDESRECRLRLHKRREDRQS